MKSEPARLEQVQRWMQAVITHAGGVAEGLASQRAKEHMDVPLAELESVIARSAALTSHERLSIYVDAYHERLLECLREEFLATRAALGVELFDALAFGYLEHYPSRSYTLHQLGGRFPQFLGELRLHAHETPPDVPPSWPEFVVELATFERLQREIFDGPGNEREADSSFARLEQLPPDQWSSVRLSAALCLRVVCFEHPVHQFWAAIRAGEAAAASTPRPTYLAVSRRDYVIQRQELSKLQFELLRRVIEGTPIAAAIVEALTVCGDDDGGIEAQLPGWFSQWAAGGYFRPSVARAS